MPRRVSSKGARRNPYEPLGSDVAIGAHHGQCVEHVRVEGLQYPVCITRDRPREVILAEVYDLLGRDAKGRPVVPDGGTVTPHTPRPTEGTRPDSSRRPAIARRASNPPTDLGE